MEFTFFPSFLTSVFSIFVGLTFGFLLQKGGVGKFNTIVGQLLLKNFTVMKVILSAIFVGGTGIYLGAYWGLVPSLHLSSNPLILSLVGGLIFGSGMSLAGYCPGTTLVALGSGAKDAFYVLCGMLLGAWGFDKLFFLIEKVQSKQDSFYQETLSSYFHLPKSSLFLFILAFLILLHFMEKKLKGFQYKPHKENYVNK